MDTKEQLKEYLKIKHDVRLNQITKDLDINEEDIDKIKLWRS